MQRGLLETGLVRDSQELPGCGQAIRAVSADRVGGRQHLCTPNDGFWEPWPPTLPSSPTSAQLVKALQVLYWSVGTPVFNLIAH